MSRQSRSITLSESESNRLEQWIRAGFTPQKVVLRARIIVSAARWRTNQHIARELKPHLIKSFKLSRDPKFLVKLTDVVGVYLPHPKMPWRSVARRRARFRR